MGAKTKNLKVMLKKEINVHEFTNAKDLEELLEYAKDNPKFSIRFDRDTNYKQLPFYTYKNSFARCLPVSWSRHLSGNRQMICCVCG